MSEEAAERQLPVFEMTARWLDIYFSGAAPDFTPKIAPRGTEFRMRVWRILMEIPWGQTMTYGEIASRIERERGGVRMSARAVGSAVGHNPISLIIPCHRVTGARRSLTGYAAGIDKKFRLLEMEKANQSGSFIPQR